jgi:hypothetical protein
MIGDLLAVLLVIALFALTWGFVLLVERVGA